jgi:hypothetical protein
VFADGNQQRASDDAAAAIVPVGPVAQCDLFQFIPAGKSSDEKEFR